MEWFLWALRSLQWILAAIGLLTLVIGLMVAVPLTQPPELQSIRAGAMAVDQSGMPALSLFQARDGSSLGYRFYPGASETQKIAIVIHGSAGNSVSMNQIAKRLAAENLMVAAVDIRGHGGSGMRGDIAYAGQLEDDFSDLIVELRRQHPNARFSVLGFSLGGGFALRVASGSLAAEFERLVLVSPFLGPDAPSTRKPENSALWASVDIPRIIALTILRRVGIDGLEALPVIAYGVGKDALKFVTPQYSFRLLADFSAPNDLDAAFRRMRIPTTIVAGGADDLMQTDRYADIVRGIQPSVDVNIVPGLGHMDMLHMPASLDAIASAMRPR
jgi:alpha-beta hydrolase superfamily lysophospholipase